MIALLQYLFFSLRVGISRTKYSVPAPKCVGNENWERLFRIQQNTMEQLIVFVPAILAFSYYVSTKWAILPGVVFILARQYYSVMYAKNPAARGFPPTFLVNVAMVIGSLIGIVISLNK
jgi:glutathione S-transferase